MSRHEPELMLAATEVVRLSYEHGLTIEQMASLVRQAADALDPPPNVPVT